MPQTREQKAEYQRRWRAEQRELRKNPTDGVQPRRPQDKRPRGRPPLEDRKILLQVRLKASVVGRMQRILMEGMAHGTSNWKNQSQMIADLIVRGLEHYASDETVAEALQYLHAVSATDTIGAHRREAQAAFSRVKMELSELIAIHATDQARHYFHATRAAFVRMSPNVWRDWFLSELDKAFPRLKALPPSKGVQLATDDDSPRKRVKAKIILDRIREPQ